MWVRNWNAERGDRLDESSVAWRIPLDALDLRGTPLLAGVDPYGDTIFNRPQVERQLPGEIAYLRERLTEPDAITMLDELERLLRVTIERPHRYLWFVGD